MSPNESRNVFLKNHRYCKFPFDLFGKGSFLLPHLTIPFVNAETTREQCWVFFPADLHTWVEVRGPMQRSANVFLKGQTENILGFVGKIKDTM